MDNDQIDDWLNGIIKVSNELKNYAHHTPETKGFSIAARKLDEARMWLSEQKKINSSYEDK